MPPDYVPPTQENDGKGRGATHAVELGAEGFARASGVEHNPRPAMTTPKLRPIFSDAPLAKLCSDHDALVVVGPAPCVAAVGKYAPVADALERAIAADATLGKAHAPVVLAVAEAPGGRVVVGATTPLTDETEDVRSIAESAFAGVARAVAAGARNPVVSISAPTSPKLARAIEVGALAALGSQWMPLEAREAGKATRAAESIGVIGLDAAQASRLAAIETGRSLCRDIAGSEPERMAPRRVAEACESAFAKTTVATTIENDVSSYPLLAAVARASNVVERHRPCVVRLEWKPKNAKRTIVLVGKGVTYDTGGADLKTDGHMAGMSRDKGGAAAVAGVMRAIAELQPENVRVVGLLGLVRNSVGEESYVSDEIITSRAGVRVRIGNTDAEGRLVLADLLAAAKEIVGDARDAMLVSIATLTGHAYRAYGPYTAAIGNAPARAEIDVLDAIGELVGEPMERSRLRREDYSFIAARSTAEDVVSCNRQASVNTARGHQFPFAFLDVAAGLRGRSLPVAHLDIAGAAVDPPDWQFGRPTAAPVTTLVEWIAR